jgi:riboflavin kinase/FMN adenylyltransferase
MEHIQTLNEIQLSQPSIVTVGMFDGVHRGHQVLVNRLVEEAHSSNRAAVVLTFFPHPDVVIRNVTGPYYLTSPETRARLLGDLGVDVVVSHPFNDTVRQIRAAEFVDQLCQYLNLSALWATADFALGYKREGTIDFLRSQGKEKGFSVETIELLLDEGSHEPISSNTIREALKAGDVAKAADYLGRPYRLSGEVILGQQRGRTIGFPTANMDVWSDQLLPDIGVYATLAHLGDETILSVTNIGKRPTFDGEGITVEAHLLDFDHDFYGETLQLDFVERLRGEVKFSGIDALVAQIRQDVEDGRKILQS